MAYYEFEFGGQVRGVKFNMASEEAYQIKGNSNYGIIWAGLIGNCVAKDIEPDFDFENVTDWTDKLYEENKLHDIDKVYFLWQKAHQHNEWLIEVKDKIRSLQNDEETKSVLKKKTLSMSG